MLSEIGDIGKWQREKYGKDKLAILIKDPKFKARRKLDF